MMGQNNFDKKLLPNEGSEFIWLTVFLGVLTLLLYYLYCYYYYQYGYQCECYWFYGCYYYYGCY